MARSEEVAIRDGWPLRRSLGQVPCGLSVLDQPVLRCPVAFGIGCICAEPGVVVVVEVEVSCSACSDRALSRAIHAIEVARRAAERKTAREIRRCLKRYIARKIYRPLTRLMSPPMRPRQT
jgi:hypothetical protein